MPATQIDNLFHIWVALKKKEADPNPPFHNHNNMLYYQGPRPDIEVPLWMDVEYNVWFQDPQQLLHNQIGNSDYAGKIDYMPVKAYNDKGE